MSAACDVLQSTYQSATSMTYTICDYGEGSMGYGIRKFADEMIDVGRKKGFKDGFSFGTQKGYASGFSNGFNLGLLEGSIITTVIIGACGATIYGINKLLIKKKSKKPSLNKEISESSEKDFLEIEDDSSGE